MLFGELGRGKTRPFGWNPVTLAPVAEYRGVALCERGGDKLAVWNGIEYHTDGLIWLCYRKLDDDKLRCIGLPDERVAKAYLDEHPDPATEFLSVREIITDVMRVPPDRQPPAPCTIWDEAAGHFVRST